MNNELHSRPFNKLTSIPFHEVKITDKFWSKRQDVNARISVHQIHEKLEENHHVDNFRVAAGVKKGIQQGAFYFDSDLYKWLEGACYILKLRKDDKLEKLVVEIVDLICKSQLNDGYLNTFYSTKFVNKRLTNLLFFHELYCAGHLFEASIAHYYTFNNTKLLDVSKKFADLLITKFLGRERRDTAGHEEIELALVKLSKITGNKEYLDLAEHFIDLRGNIPNYKTYLLRMIFDLKATLDMAGFIKKEYFEKQQVKEVPKEDETYLPKAKLNEWVKFFKDYLNGEYFQLDKPVREIFEPVGHSVRALYFYDGIAKLYSEKGEKSLLKTIERIWLKMVKARMYITGGTGSAKVIEGFRKDFDIKNEDCFSETCAYIANIFWNWDLLKITGKSKYADLIEKLLYNGILVSQSLDGMKYFYSNKIISEGSDERQNWFECACCPTNYIRLIPTIGKYIYSTSPEGIWIHQYIGSEVKLNVPNGNEVSLTQQSAFPWEGKVSIQLVSDKEASFSLFLRVPEWATTSEIHVDGEKLNGPIRPRSYVRIFKSWPKNAFINMTFPMTPKLNQSDPRIITNLNKRAISRGPLVYCMEQIDNPEFDIFQCELDNELELNVLKKPDLLGGINVIQGKTAEDEIFLAIPYYAWANRGPSKMQIWNKIKG